MTTQHTVFRPIHGRVAHATGGFLAILACSAASCRSGADARPSPVVWQAPRVTLGAVGDLSWGGVPAVAEDVAVVDVGSGFAALDVATGALRWNAQPWSGRQAAATHNLVARDGRVYVLEATRSRAAALDLRDGHVLWDVPIAQVAIRFTAAADSTAFYVGTQDKAIIALDASSGAERWRRDLGSSWAAGFLAGAMAHAGVLYVAGARPVGSCAFCMEEVTAALSVDDGRVLWQHAEGDSASDAASAPTIAGELMVTGGLAHGVLARARETGETRWRAPGAERYTAMLSPPVVQGDTVIVGDGPLLSAMRLGDGQPLYSLERPSSIRYVAPCAGRLLVSRQALDIVDPVRPRVLGTWLNQEYGGLGFVTSGFGVSGDRAVLSTSSHIIGIRCR